jgi:TPR repeat protein
MQPANSYSAARHAMDCLCWQPCHSNNKQKEHCTVPVVVCLQPDEEAAMLNYYFGALGGDSLSRMALAYRHLHGRGVPKSCWTAASYYLPVAEEVGLCHAAQHVVSLVARHRPACVLLVQT